MKLPARLYMGNFTINYNDKFIIIYSLKMLRHFQESLAEHTDKFEKLVQCVRQIKMIDKFKTTFKKFIKWLCHKFSYPSEDELVRDFEKETHTNFNFEKQLVINEFKKKDDDFDIEYQKRFDNMENIK